MHRFEQETIINFSAIDKEMLICTSDPVQIRRLDRLVEQFPEQYKYINSEFYKGEEVLKRYKAPKKLLGYRKPVILSEEEKEKLRQQLAKARGDM